MGRAGRVACIFTPMALTIASFVCMLLVELGGWSSSSPALNAFYFFQADFANFTTSAASSLDNTTTLTAALDLAKSDGLLRDRYQIHLWNYCTASGLDGKIDSCSPRQGSYVFDPVEVWGLNATTTSASLPSSTDANIIQSEAATLKSDTEGLENRLLGKAGVDALNAYRNVAKWNFIAYEVAFWTTLATILVGILAIFSRWGSLLTWLLAVVSTFFSFGASLTSTVLFGVLVGALKSILNPYNISITLGNHLLAVTWLGTAFSLAATLFWLFSICCCSGRSNPHHRSNKGGLWNAEPKGAGYGDYGRGRGLKVEKTGGGYERVASPFVGEDGHGDRVPLQQYPAPQTGYQHAAPGGAYEPFRNS